jgi:hypothetical protein
MNMKMTVLPFDFGRCFMPMVAQQAPYTLFLVDDNYPESPREDRDNFGKMVCWNRRHTLGDEHSYSEPRDFLQSMLFDKYAYNEKTEYGKPIYDFIKNGKTQEVRLEYNRSTREWELLENNHWSTSGDWYVSSTYPANLKGKDVPDYFLNDCLSALRMSELKKLVEQMEGMAILPLFLYDHSGITMNTGGFSCPWDSGQVGWIYADNDMIKKEYGDVTPETIERAKKLMESEVEDYDYYLTGQCYGFKLYEGDNEIDSCWGFLGDINDVAKYIKEYLPSDCENIVDSLQYQSDIDEDEYLEQTIEAEDEMEI